VADLGDAYCEELERIAIGPFRLEDADPERVLPLESALAFLPERVLGDDEAVRVAHGLAVAAGGVRAEGVRLTHDGRLLSIARSLDSGDLKPFVVFAP
jgi:tRNA pseudouridine55 synthase